jgi:hypothetical protein
MSDPVAELRAELVAAASRQATAASTAPRRSRAGSLRGRHLAALAALLVFSGSAAAAVVKLSEERSAPLSGTLPHLHSSGGGKPSSSGERYRFTMLPDLEAGRTGWCENMTITTAAGSGGGGGGGGGGGCGPAPLASQHLIGGGSMVVSGNRILEYALVDSHVASVRFNGRLIRTISSTGLPHGWRAAVAVLGLPRGPHGELRDSPWMRWTALSRQDRPFPRPRRAGRSLNARTRAVSSKHPATGRCSIHQTEAIAGLRTTGAEVIRGKPRRLPPLDGPAFTSCAETTFKLDGNTLTASVLINAAHPLRAPAALPGASANPRGPGVVEISTGMQQTPTRPLRLFGTEPVIEGGPIAARRDGAAWLAVQGGTTEQRDSLLASLATDS